jgi:hypothetical protein
MVAALEQLLGLTLMLAVLADVFLTVLYARAGTGLISERLGRLIWHLFRAVASGRDRSAALSICGPVILVALVLTWSVTLAVGAGLLCHPELGSGITTSNGATPTDLMTAIYVGGSSLSIVGGSNYSPQTAAMKILFLLNSVIGTSVISLTLTYLMQVYTALRERNAFGLRLHAMSAETGDAAELLVGLFQHGKFSNGYSSLSNVASALAAIKEAHHFYPVLFYFRFREPYYALSRAMLITLDAASLIRAALDDEETAWLKDSTAVRQLWSISLMLLATVSETFLDVDPDKAAVPQADERAQWRARYHGAFRSLAEAGLPLRKDEEAGAEAYFSQRSAWDHLITALAPAMAYSLPEIDPAADVGLIPTGQSRPG